ncbi:MAG: FAD-dependent oxidoreductase [Dermatophilus congolensis]|nr:FAD-dependent oxidoreductase [Dermatophilus congolensis]
MKRIVVLGNGIAALTAAEAVRDRGFDGDLTIVGEESHAPYSRPALSKAALLDDDPAHLRLPDSTHGATELLGTRAESLDLDRRTVRISTGDELPFDGLVIATGSRPRRILPVASGSLLAPADPSAPAASDTRGATESPNLGRSNERSVEQPATLSPEVFLRNLDDMIALRTRLHDHPSVVVVGGGPLGMEIASGARAAGCEVTLVARGAPMRRHLGAYLSDIAVAAARELGVTVLTDGCATVRQNLDGLADVVLHDGSVVSAEVLVSAVGDVPNLEWLDGSGVLTDGQVVVDSRGRVLVGGVARPDIVAAGDVATFPTSSGVRRVPLWTSAIDQAKVAGPALLLGDEAPALDFKPYFWTEQFGLNIRACGPEPLDDAPEVVDGDPADPSHSALLRWPEQPGRSGTSIALNYRIPIPRLRRLAQPAPATA